MDLDKIFTSLKSILTLAIIVFVIFGGYSIVSSISSYFTSKIDLDKMILENQKTFVEIAKGISKKEVMVSTELLEMRMKELDGRILKYIEQNNKQITDIGKSVATLQGSVNELASTQTYVDKEDSNKNFDAVVIYREETAEDDPDQKLPVSTMYYSPGDHENPWTSNTHPLKIHYRVVLAEDKNKLTTDSIMNAWITNDYMAESRGKKFPMKFDNIEWVRRQSEKRFMWNPRVSLGVGIGEEIYPNLGLSLFSYGRTKHNMDWRFIDVGVGGINDNYYVQLAPVEYNLGKQIPLIENLFLGPYVNIDKDTEVGWGMNLDVPF